jgi:hypothetical protein
MSFTVDSVDRDGDERDDVRVEVTLLAEKTVREATAQLIWLDRAAGPARIPNEPTQSLTDIGSVEAVRAGGKNTAQQVRERVDNARRLYAALCAEGGTPRVFDQEGAPLPCAGLDRAFEAYATAELEAALVRADFVAAFGVLARDGWYYAPLSSKVRSKLEAQVLSKVTVRKADGKTLGPLPRVRSGIPRWSPLWFEDDGSLLVQTVASIERVSADGETAASADEEVDPWPSTVADPEGSRLWGVSLPCDRSEVLLLRVASNGSPQPPIPTDLLAPRRGACGRGAGPTADLPVPVEWTEQQKSVLVAGSLFGAGAASGAPHPGSPRSPDGKRLILPTALGLLVTGGDRPELFQLEGGVSGLSDCVVANGARAAACIGKDGRAVLLLPR